MKYILLLSILIFTSLSCKKDKVEISRDVESHSSSSFIKYDSDINMQDFFLTEEEHLIIVGNGKGNSSPKPTPYILQLDFQKEISWINFIDLDQKSIYRKITACPTIDNDFMMLSYSDPENNSEFNIDVIKISQSGNEIWKKTISVEGDSFRATSIIQLPNEDYLIYSMVEQEEFSFENKLQLIKISSNGELIWIKEIDDNINNSRQLVYFPEQNCVIGISEKSLGVQNGELKIHKFDLDGNIIWKKIITAPGDIWSLSSTITKLDDEKFIISFSSFESQSSDHDIFLIKMNQEGIPEWNKIYGGNKIEIPDDIIQTNDGDFVLLSSTSSFGNGGFDVMLSKFDESGELIWEKTYGSSMSDQSSKIEEMNNGNLVIIGNTNEGNSSAGKFNAFLLETDHEGNPK